MNPVQERRDERSKMRKRKSSGKKNVPQPSEALFCQESRQQPGRDCKNGITPGFYKPSPRRSSSSSPSTVNSPKASVKGQHRCSQCKQNFRERDKLMTHIKDFHTIKKPKFACTECRQLWDDERSFRIHMRQHEIDRVKGKK